MLLKSLVIKQSFQNTAGFFVGEELGADWNILIEAQIPLNI